MAHSIAILIHLFDFYYIALTRKNKHSFYQGRCLRFKAFLMKGFQSNPDLTHPGTYKKVLDNGKLSQRNEGLFI